MNLDAFFDGDAGGIAGDPSQVRAISPDLNEYHDPSAVEFGGGRSLQDMTAGRGPRGVVIPRATAGGVPGHLNIHDTREFVAHVDPHIPDARSTVRLGDFTKQSVAKATDAARAFSPEPATVAQHRFRGAAIMHQVADMFRRDGSPLYDPSRTQQTRGLNRIHLAGQDNGGGGVGATVVQPSTIHQEQPQMQQPQPQPQQPQPQQPVKYSNVTPLQAFHARQDTPAAPQVAPQAVQSQPSPVKPQPPTIKVQFEIEGFGVHTARYHDVIIDKACVVLIFDERYEDGDPYWPATNDHPLALHVVGTNEAHMVYTTGIQYSYAGATHCLLMLDRTASLTNEQPQQPTQPVGPQPSPNGQPRPSGVDMVFDGNDADATQT